MSGTLLAITGSLLYLFSAGRQWQVLNGDRHKRKSVTLTVTACALLLHLSFLFDRSQGALGFDLSFFNVGALISWVISLIVLLSSLRKPLENLLIGILPFTATIILVANFAPSTPQTMHLSGGLGWHIVLSILAYSVFCIAAVQAILLYLQDKHLKSHQTHGLIQALPPLQTMDALLFDMIWMGMILLSASFIIGWPFVDDLHGQHLVHKTVLSLAAWLVFALLLFGRHYLGWRGRVASRWTLVGTGFLVLAYFGSKFALEILLR